MEEKAKKKGQEKEGSASVVIGKDSNSSFEKTPTILSVSQLPRPEPSQISPSYH